MHNFGFGNFGFNNDRDNEIEDGFNINENDNDNNNPDTNLLSNILGGDNTEILLFIIVFLLLFTTFGRR